MVDVNDKYETKRHSFRVLSEEFGGFRKEIITIYESRLQFLIASERGEIGKEEGDSNELEETLHIQYWLDGSRECVSFVARDENYDEIYTPFETKKVDERVRKILLRELPEYVSRILPKE